MLKNDIAALAPMPDDPILGLVSLYQADERPNKVNLGVGVYLNEAGKVPLLEVVEEAERRMTNRHQPRTYMPMSGLPVLDAAADVEDDLPERRTHGNLDESGIVDVSGKGEGLGSVVVFRADGLIPGGALLDDGCHVAVGLHII